MAETSQQQIQRLRTERDQAREQLEAMSDYAMKIPTSDTSKLDALAERLGIEPTTDPVFLAVATPNGNYDALELIHRLLDRLDEAA